MTPEQFEQIERLFEEASALAASQRSAFLDRACQDAVVRREVEALLGEDDLIQAKTETLGHKIDAARQAWDRPAQDVAPPQLEHYTVLGQLGEGGFGTVYRARQEHPIRRDVALKIIKLGMDTRQVIARFEAERQALAMMDHPGIAKVLDAGATDTGRPYFVMELVGGAPITTYCDRHNLAMAERLELFTQVCHAVQHAHQKGIIHRDIKPSNVLVTEQDGRPVPKVIDFGIAKATAQRLTEHAVFTEQGVFIGTPEYMSPEQAARTEVDIDTRSDIYSLGVLLYELLTGTTPFDGRRLRSAAYGEIQRIIREEEPPRPSTRLSTLGADAGAVARRRQVDVHRLRKSMRGDLDWIIMKCLEKDRARRYESASGLAEDLARHLHDEPVLASPPSASYRMRKMIRRHRGAFIATSLILSVLVLGMAGTLTGWVRATSARTEAVRQRERADSAARQAQEDAQTARRITDFLVGLFEASDPKIAAGETVTARDLLDKGAVDVEALDDEPHIQVELRETIGWIFLLLGQYDAARPLLDKAHSYRLDHPDNELALAASLHRMANLHDAVGSYDAAEPLAARSVEIRRRLLGDSRELAESLNTLGNVVWHQGRLDEAETIHRAALAIRENILPADHDDIAKSLHNIGALRYFASDYAAAEDLYKRSIDIERQHGEDNYHLATSMHVLAIVYQDQGKYSDALRLETRSLQIREHVLGPQHTHVALSLTTLGNIYKLIDQPEKAVPYIERAVTIAEEAWGPDHGELWWMKRSLARALIDAGHIDRAHATLEELIGTIEAAEKPHSLPYNLNTLATLALERNDLAEAERLYSRSNEINAAEIEQGSAGAMLGVAGMARVRHAQGRLDDAYADFMRALPPMTAAWGPQDRDTLETRTHYAALLDDRGDLEAAVAEARAIIAIRQAQADTPQTTAHALDQTARTLLTIRPATVRDAQAALTYALRATTAERTNPRYLATLARAQAATADLSAASTTQQRAIDALPAGSPLRPIYQATLETYHGQLRSPP